MDSTEHNMTVPLKSTLLKDTVTKRKRADDESKDEIPLPIVPVTD